MSKFTRRTVMQGGLAAVGALAAPRIVLGQKVGSKVLRTVGDITSYDPVTSTSFATLYHANMVYDTLFGFDMQGIARPQMVGKYGMSNDKLTWTFELRDGLKFHDGTPVTSTDAVASIRRWAARNNLGQLMMTYTKDISAKDSKTFTIELKERFGVVLDALAGVCFIMRKKEAETDPNQNITSIVGSGPFRFNQAATRPGSQYIYDRNPEYVPRNEPPSGTAGGKVVKLDRVIYVNMPDAQTAVAALQAGEIDYYGSPPPDSLGQLSKDKNVKLEVLYPMGQIGLIRLNFLYPPFDNVKCRQAVLNVVRQIDFLKGNYPDPKYYKTCGSLFACGGSMENDANTDWFRGAPNYAKAKRLLMEGGYDGRPVVILQPTDWAEAKNAAEILADEMRRGGFNVQLEPMALAAIMARSNSKAFPEQGGWNVFITSGGGSDANNPLWGLHGTNGEKGWLGWPTDAKTEELRAKWASAESMEQRKEIAREMQTNAWNFVPMVYWGQWTLPSAMRTNVSGVLPAPFAWMRPWWNVDKT